MKSDKHRKAFTLVEMLVVLLMIGILFVVLISRVNFAPDKAREVGAQNDLHAYQDALQIAAHKYNGFSTVLGASPDDAKYTKLAGIINQNLDANLFIELTPVSNRSTTSDGLEAGRVDIFHAKTGVDPWGKPYKLEYILPDGSDATDFGAIAVRSAGKDMNYYTEDDIVTSVRYSVNAMGASCEVVWGNDVSTSSETGTTAAPLQHLYQEIECLHCALPELSAPTITYCLHCFAEGNFTRGDYGMSDANVYCNNCQTLSPGIVLCEYCDCYTCVQCGEDPYGGSGPICSNCGEGETVGEYRELSYYCYDCEESHTSIIYCSSCDGYTCGACGGTSVSFD